MIRCLLANRATTQACDRFLPPDLEVIWKELHHVGESLDEDVRAKLRAGMRRTLERCWPGEQQLISRLDLLAEARTAELPAELRAQIEALLAPVF